MHVSPTELSHSFSNLQLPCQLFVPHMCPPLKPVFYPYFRSHLSSLRSLPGLCVPLSATLPWCLSDVLGVLEPTGTTSQSQLLTSPPNSSVVRCHIGISKSATERVFIPQELANGTNQVSFLRLVGKHLPAQYCDSSKSS